MRAERSLRETVYPLGNDYVCRRHTWLYNDQPGIPTRGYELAYLPELGENEEVHPKHS